MQIDQITLITLSHDELKAHWKSIMTEGALFVLLGVLAFIMPLAFSLAFDIVLGWLFLIGGAIQLYSSLQSRKAPGFVMGLVSSIIFLLFGIMMIFNPLQSLAALTALVATVFLIEGIVKLIYSVQIKPFANHIGVLISGVCSILIAVMAYTGWPFSATWFIGILLSAYLMINGLGLMIISYQVHHE